MSVSTPYRTYKLQGIFSSLTTSERIIEETYCGTKRSNVRTLPELEVCFRTAKNRCTNDVTNFERVRIWVNTICVCTVTQLQFAEPICPVAIFDEDVVRFDICSLVSHL